jgi:tRNA A-37 threonylcarbamoyl transferase component Bud32
LVVRLDPLAPVLHNSFMKVERHITPNPSDLLQACYMQPQERIGSFMLGGRRYWAKRPETLSLLLRLQKGDARVSFQREIALMRAFAGRGAPVVPILAQADDLVVMPDMGRSLFDLAHTQPVDQLGPILQHAAKALAMMHAKGLAHGRPSLRDIVWTGSDICFLDLEAGARLNASPLRRARDLLLLVLSVYQHRAGLGAHVPALLAAYAQADQAAILPVARRLARVLTPLRWLAAPVAARDLRRGKPTSEALAIAPTLRALTA